jgi:hypothetical protein
LTITHKGGKPSIISPSGRGRGSYAPISVEGVQLLAAVDTMATHSKKCGFQRVWNENEYILIENYLTLSLLMRDIFF